MERMIPLWVSLACSIEPSTTGKAHLRDRPSLYHKNAISLSWTWNIKLSPGSSTRERFKPCVLSRALTIQTN
ncbi:hypothetical protein FPSE_00729 [Fusarium pseudograminearum CS3096]|uniref:Uncharacterized protein n=1 Tax=Fusarium pseudograminearum (strain CS3096) TaxID=1028729 RepID=K3VW48_FUSPC|nr:hypothetical protein FPSE_00729 [Fusarium pseudograminearum CS3096]EKJ79128.1 hypothetical protein FPSE_00729 [Fusarium pseudograminearum CS3096]